MCGRLGGHFVLPDCLLEFRATGSPLSREHRITRLNFVEKKLPEDCSRLLFSDESQFCLTISFRRGRLWRRSGRSCNSNDEASRLKEERGMYSCCDSNLNFSTATCSEDDCEYGPYKKNKVARQDPMSHRIIEKRRRDRMNNCLADLSRLIPTEYLKKGRGRIEKTEIIEMAIKHMKYLQQEQGNPVEHYRLGYQECMSEAMRFMVEVEGHFPREAICVRLLNHLQKHCESLSRVSNSTSTNSTTTEHNTPVNAHHAPVITNGNNNNIQMKGCEFSATPKNEPEPNNNHSNSNGFAVNSAKHPSSEAESEKHAESNAYKYKTNIKLRFSQDINAHETPKRPKLDNGRRNSVTSVENQSSTHSSPPSSEPCTRISDSENVHRRTPSDCVLVHNNSTNNINNNNNNSINLEAPRPENFSPNNKNPLPNDLKHNFNVPIFVLHAKGTYYVPVTIDYKTLLPFLHNYDILEVVPATHNIVLHPVTINVNFLPNATNEVNKYKPEYNSWQ